MGLRVILSSPRKTETTLCLFADENNLGGSQLLCWREGITAGGKYLKMGKKEDPS